MSDPELVQFAAGHAGAAGAGAQAEMMRRTMNAAAEQTVATRELREELVVLLRLTAQLHESARESAEQSKAMFDLARSELRIARYTLLVSVAAVISSTLVSVL